MADIQDDECCLCTALSHDVFGVDGNLEEREKEVLMEMYGGLYKYKTTATPVSCSNNLCKCTFHKECIYKLMYFNVDYDEQEDRSEEKWKQTVEGGTVLCPVCKKGLFTQANMNVTIRNEKKYLKKLRDNLIAEEHAQIRRATFQEWKKQYKGAEVKIKCNDGSIVSGKIIRCADSSCIKEKETQWIIALPNKKFLKVPHALIGNGTSAIVERKCKQMHGKSNREKKSKDYSPCANPDCDDLCFGKWCSTLCQRESSNNEEMAKERG